MSYVHPEREEFLPDVVLRPTPVPAPNVPRLPDPPLRRLTVQQQPGSTARRTATSLAVVVLGIVLAMSAALPAQARDVGYEGSVHAGINGVRRPDAAFGPCVDRQAERWAHHLAATRVFEHSDIRATLRVCNARWVGEIIAWGRWTSGDVIQAWLHSPAHRRVMLNHVYRRMGVASVRYGSHGERATVVQFITH
jgi:hypothetical protein